MAVRTEIRRRLWFPVCLGIGLLGGCAGQASRIPPAGMSVSELLARAPEFDGRQVILHGWASVNFEDYGIWETREDYLARSPNKCVSLLNRYRDPGRNEEVDRSLVTVRGTFTKDISHDEQGGPVVRIGGCSDSGIRFDDPDGLQRRR